MISMQYRIILPADYDMNIIKQRIANNGIKTDGFQDLLFKAYLITEKDQNSAPYNEYSPLYLWQNQKGMNQFIFNGFYDNILNSFGWQSINLNVLYHYELLKDFQYSTYLIEVQHSIPESLQMKKLDYSLDFPHITGKMLTYNPTEWLYTEYYFLDRLSKPKENMKIYKILHISQ